MESETRHAALLRGTLKANAAFSALSGAVFLLLAGFLATLVAIGRAGFMQNGVSLLLFAGLLIFLATRRRVDRWWILSLVLLIAAMDLLWVAGSAIMILMPSLTTTAGAVLVGATALAVGAFAALQLYSLVRIVFTRRRGALAGAAVATLALLSVGCGPADIRNARLREAGDSQESIARGRELMRQVTERHGLEAWQSFSTVETVAVDEWPGIVGSRIGWWPETEQRFRTQAILGTFTSRVELLDGSGEGEILGIQGWRGYRGSVATDGFDPVTGDGLVEFYLPTLHYFSEFPFRMLRAELVSYGGETTLDGRDHHLLYATWGSLEANTEHDQYLIWVDKETLLIRKCLYTVREAFGGATGTIHFDDYRDVQGVMFSFKHTVTLPRPEHALEPLDENFFHQVRFESISYDTVERRALLIDPQRNVGDFKRTS